MKINQISVFLENQSGRLSEVARILSDNNINICALSLADTSDFGILRMIVSDSDRALEVLRQARFTVAQTQVVAVRVLDQPGGLAAVLDIIRQHQVSIEYMYAYLHHRIDDAVMIFRFENTDETLDLLQQSGLPIMRAGDLL